MTDKTKWVVKDPKRKKVFLPSPAMKKRAYFSSTSLYTTAAKNPKKFWGDMAKEAIDWKQKWNKVYEEKPPYFKWFLGGKLNVSYNCLDRHLEKRGNKVAMIWEAEPLGERERKYTYRGLYREVCKFSNVLRKLGVRKGDRVGIYLPMIPETMIVMLACARIGAIHSVVFSAFSGVNFKKRVDDCEAKVLITCDGYWRRNKAINLKSQADIAAKAKSVKKVVVVKRFEGKSPVKVVMKKGRDLWYHELMENASEDSKPVPVESNTPLFLLYTSGTTGKPKGVIHDTGGYLTQAYLTTKLDFDLHDDDVFWCTADVGWITGHTYACYGPLSLGATMVIYEGSPDMPDWGRLWAIADKFDVSVFYTAPTAIRMFKKMGKKWPKRYDLSTLRILGTVGEPIDKETWDWYFDYIGHKRCPVIDTWWQTETGGTLVNALPGIGPFIPTVAGRPFPGTRAAILDDKGQPVKKGETGYLVFKSPFPPGLLRGVWKNPKKYKDTYWGEYGNRTYFTADGAKWYDKHNIRITGRVDDVMKVAGHRLSSAEVEDAITSHPLVIESAVVPKPDEIRGQVPIAFVVLRPGIKESEALGIELVKLVRKVIGPTAKPHKVYFVEGLPKTRSGKIMRRFLRSMLVNEKLGDKTTLQNPQIVDYLKKVVGYKKK
ncbi:MAG: acetate--CoA ligase [Candidatus Diapherotrites archaeon]|uniref:Acetate--CoA ligase n=1 Tax=Candidatus Iainarchaeum sp. TaxID=3101447 RepID=A0A2D6M1C2_9ARCH|nr:acetate--CoA ligase [Candidatus Diapherotrites archaeon]|tara:strand:- start:5145 stop:7118 length:1974 start_codon:yes stop_codon:yes gene_type:complete